MKQMRQTAEKMKNTMNFARISERAGIKEKYQELKREKALTEAAYLASLIELKAEVKCMLNQ